MATLPEPAGQRDSTGPDRTERPRDNHITAKLVARRTKSKQTANKKLTRTDFDCCKRRWARNYSQKRTKRINLCPAGKSQPLIGWIFSAAAAVADYDSHDDIATRFCLLVVVVVVLAVRCSSSSSSSRTPVPCIHFALTIHRPLIGGSPESPLTRVPQARAKNQPRVALLLGLLLLCLYLFGGGRHFLHRESRDLYRNLANWPQQKPTTRRRLDSACWREPSCAAPPGGREANSPDKLSLGGGCLDDPGRSKQNFK